MLRKMVNVPIAGAEAELVFEEISIGKPCDACSGAQIVVHAIMQVRPDSRAFR